MSNIISAEEARSIARTTAYLYRDTHSYLPRTLEESKDWEPHSWAITAIMAGAAAMLNRQED